jgi:hypothetical protein
MEAMPKRFPEEFKRDVANVARRGDLKPAGNLGGSIR